MPAPFAMPVTVTGTPSTTIAPRRALRHGVGGHDRRHRGEPVVAARARFARAGSAATIFATGSGSMITPVENGSTSLRRAAEQRRDRGAGRLRGGDAGRAGAGVGVAGVDDQRADRRLSPRGGGGRRCTGAAQKRFCVNTPAAVVPGSNTDEQQVVALPVLDLRRRRCRARRREPAAAHRAWAACSERALRQSWLVAASTSFYASRPWHCLYFLPDPHGHGSLRPTFSPGAHERRARPCGGSSAAPRRAPRRSRRAGT